MTTAHILTSRRLGILTLCVVGFSLLPSAALAAASLDIYPTGAREAVAEHGLMGLLYLKQMWALVFVFLALVFVAHRFVFGPLLASIDERDRQIRGALERAAEIGTRTDTLLTRHHEAIGDARTSAQGERQNVVDAARQRSQEKIQGAQQEAEVKTQAMRREVEQSIDAARDVLRGDADTLADSIADHLLGRSAS